MTDLTREQIENIKIRWLGGRHSTGFERDLLALCDLAIRGLEQEWQPIETAPRDRWILGVNARGSSPHIPFLMRSTFINDEEFDSCAGEACWRERLADWPSYPTHWMPLPAAPKGDRDDL